MYSKFHHHTLAFIGHFWMKIQYLTRPMPSKLDLQVAFDITPFQDASRLQIDLYPTAPKHPDFVA